MFRKWEKEAGKTQLPLANSSLCVSVINYHHGMVVSTLLVCEIVAQCLAGEGVTVCSRSKFLYFSPQENYGCASESPA